MQTATHASSTDLSTDSWVIIALVPFLVIAVSLVQYQWGATWWRLAPGLACAGYALRCAISIFPNRKVPVPTHLLSQIESAWVAANLWSIVGLMIHAEDLFTLRYAVIVCVLTIVVLMRRPIPVA